MDLNTGEYISRDEVFNAMKMDIRPPFAVVRDFPAADVRPVVHGVWEHLGGDDWQCSECGFVTTVYGSWAAKELCNKNFCENCGAEMTVKRW